MMTWTRGPICAKNNPPSRPTPGPCGRNDAADPNNRVIIRARVGPVMSQQVWQHVLPPDPVSAATEKYEACIKTLETEPSIENLEAAVQSQAALAEETRKAGLAEMDLFEEIERSGIGRVALALWRKVDEDFRATPSTANFWRLLEISTKAQQIGVDYLEDPPGWRPLGPVEGKLRLHQVAEGESLSSLSKKYYRSSSYWDKIYLFNVKKVGKNPDLIRVGTLLDIP